MNQIRLNGVEISYQAAPESPIQELMEQIRHDFNSDSSLISSIKINGRELNAEGEEAIAALPVSQIRSLEVFTAHPRELAEETLQSLIEFTSHLENFSRQAADHLEAGHSPQEFVKLVEGIETFTEALVSAKQILRIGIMTPVNALEVDMNGILKDLVLYAENGQRDYVIDLMRNHLPDNLAQWRLSGIPALIRSRDS